MLRFLLGLLFSVAISAGQPAFEVATIKLAVVPPGAPEHMQYHMTVSSDASRIEYANASAMDLLRTAFRVSTYQISGPGWITTQRFDIVAKIPEGATRDQAPEMLQRLLADRFALVVHRGREEHPVLAMVPGKNGPKLKETPADSSAPAAGGFSRSFGAGGSLQMEIRRMTTAALAELLGSFLDQPVADLTGLKGTYDLSLSFSQEDLRVAANAAGLAATVSGNSAPPSDSTIAASLERLGLKLEGRKTLVDVIVVDHLEKVPAAN